MARSFLQEDTDVENELVRYGTVVLGLVVLYWLSFLSFNAAGVIHSIAGIIFVLFIPGAMLSYLVGVQRQPKGIFLLYAFGLSFALFTITTVFASLFLPWLGVDSPLAPLPLAFTHTGLLLGLLGALYYTETRTHRPTHFVPDLSFKTGLLCLLPVSAAIAALAMNRFGSPVGMYLFVVLLGGVVLASTTRLIPTRRYATVVYVVSLSMLLHRNLVSDYIIGADIQDLFAIAEHVHLTQGWSPTIGGMASSLPAVTAVPAAIATLTGLPLLLTFKLVLVLLFSLVPVGIYYLGTDIFDAEIALYGALFFTFYHVSFYFTPGKQLLAELFVVLSLLTLRYEPASIARKGTLGLLSTGLVLTHYGMTYAFGFALFVGVLALFAFRQTFDGFTFDLPLWQPVFLIGGGILWYTITAPEAVVYLLGIPESIFSQTVALLTTGSIEGSGSSYVQQSTWFDQLNIALYIFCTGLMVVGLGRQVFSQITRLLLGEDPADVEYSVIAVPLLGLLVASYFLVLNLWADRVYQLVLVILAFFMPLGVGFLSKHTLRVFSSSDLRQHRQIRRPLLAIVVVLLLVVNSGFLAGLAGAADTSTFNSDANDLIFSSEEREGVTWIEADANVSRTNQTTPPDGTGLTVDDPDRVQIFTDPTSYQLFRSQVSPRFHNVELIMVKNRWQPSIVPDRLSEGYIYIRKASISDAADEESVPPSALSQSEVATLRDAGETAYQNEDVLIIKIDE